MTTIRARRGRRLPAGVRAFTLIELLVVMAIIGLLAALLLPALSRANEKAKVTRAHAELYGVGLALEMYSGDNDGKLPPVRVNCNSDLATHWCEFPVELAEQHYLGRGSKPGMAATMEDVFNPEHTYKYAAPGPELLNDTRAGNYQMWVPDDAPTCASTNGQYYSTLKSSPVRWVVWSLGPRPQSAKTQDPRAPIASRSWYRRAGEGGVIMRFATREGMQVKSP
jgi:prepilin-type N-terminal cleavage/methylation domain-containing protein